ncbi:MAG: hypothetical protein WCG78_03290 [Candidatus Omnitrophota bacterium]
MKRALVLIGGLTVIAVLSGCGRVQVRTIEVQRSDSSVAGNQGVIFGKIPAAHLVNDPARRIVAIDVELPTAAEIKKAVMIKPKVLK